MDRGGHGRRAKAILDVSLVELDGPQRDPHLTGDLLAGLALCRQPQDGNFLLAQHAHVPRLGMRVLLIPETTGHRPLWFLVGSPFARYMKAGNTDG
jgi:hypothetical protein